MSPFMKGLIVCLTLLILLAAIRSSPIEQADFESPLLWDLPSFLDRLFQVTTRQASLNEEGDILVDNFEYSDSPYNHGWNGTYGIAGSFVKNS